MKFFLAFCFVAAVAQAVNVDWDSLQTPEVFPEGLLEEIVSSGLEPKEVESRITNGKEASPGQFPYQIGLMAATAAGTGFCGGSILNNEWILTAAHCVDGATSVNIILGAHNVKDTAEKGQITVAASKIIIHKNWNPKTIKNDIALIKLASSVPYSARVQPIRLPSRSQASDTFAGTTATVSGWGRDSDSATAISPVLRYTSNPILQNSKCNKNYFGQVGSNQVCLAGTGGRSSCNGDSGGPLVVTEKDGKSTQIGLVSFGVALGCSIGWPGVYTRTTHFLDWIETNTGGAIVARN